MDILGRLLTGGLHAGTPDPTEDFWYGPTAGSMSSAGIRVSPEQAETVSAFYRGVWLLSNAVASLPLFVYRRLADGGKDKAAQHPLYDILHTAPNPWQTSFEWRRLMMRHLILRGNGYNRILPGPRGFADSLVPIHPDLVTPEQLDSGRILYKVRNVKTGLTTTYTQDDIFHLRGASDDGVTGKSVIAWARDSLGLALATEGYASRLFSQGAQHGGVLKIPGILGDEAGRRLATSFREKTAGLQNAHMPVVLEQGMEFVPTTMTAEDSQYLMSRKFSVAEMARWLGVPPHMLFDLERATFSNIEHQAIAFVVDDLMPWLVLWEQAISRDLILATQTYFAEFNVEGRLRGDSASRGTFYGSMFGIGAISDNEIRDREGLNRVENGDKYYVQGAMRPTDEPYQASGSGARAPASTTPAQAPARKTDTKATAIVQESAARLLRKEIAAVQRLAVRHAADGDAFAAAITEFYADHVTLVSQTLQMSEAEAQGYCAGQAAQVVDGQWIAAVEQWGTESYAAGLALMALDEVA
jgi:HK97 family phage portal protein